MKKYKCNKCFKKVSKDQMGVIQESRFEGVCFECVKAIISNHALPYQEKKKSLTVEVEINLLEKIKEISSMHEVTLRQIVEWGLQEFISQYNQEPIKQQVVNPKK